jgi:uncharacterized membrane protein (UPF0127 family)
MRAMPPRTGLLIPHCRSVHTFGMRFALDLIWLDAEGQIADVTARVGPRRVVVRRHARAVVEVESGSGALFFTALVGTADRLAPYLRRL